MKNCNLDEDTYSELYLEVLSKTQAWGTEAMEQIQTKVIQDVNACIWD